MPREVHRGRKKTTVGYTVKKTKCPTTHLPNLSAQAQNFEISMKKGFIGRP